jgi:hypothetical protein
MSIRNYLQGVRKMANRGRTARRQEKQLRQRRQRFVRLGVERLEDRTLLSGTWATLANAVPSPNGTGTMMLLSNGDVMVQGGGDNASNAWYLLTPGNLTNTEILGVGPLGLTNLPDYENGTWSQLPSMNTSRLFYASNVLQNGNVFVAGGEYTIPNSQTQTETNAAEIYNPTAPQTTSQAWTNIPGVPTPSNSFGDLPTEVLPNGTVLAGDHYGSPNTYIYNPTTNLWSPGPSKLYSDSSAEESWVKLANNDILDYDMNGTTPQVAQRYDPSLNQWIASGTVPVQLRTTNGSDEIGPGVLLPDGRAFYLGGSGYTAFYTLPSSSTAPGSWQQGPNIPLGLTSADAPAAILPNGDVLFAASPPIYPTGNPANPFAYPGPTTLFEFNPTTWGFTNVTPPDGNLSEAPFVTRMLDLPSGQVLFTDSTDKLWLYTPSGSPSSAWQPTINNITSNADGSFTLTGGHLNGISEGAYYGDDAEMSSNYPIVQIYTPLGNSFYGRTFNWDGTGNSVQFTLPSGFVQPGEPYVVSVIAYGIASNPVLFVPAGTGTNNTVLVQADPNALGNIQIVQEATYGYHIDISSSSISGIIVDGVASTSNHLTVNYATGGFFSTPITFDGGAGGNNTLTVTDQGDSNAGSWALTNGALFGRRTNSSIGGSVFYNQVQTVSLDSSAGGGSIAVEGTSPNVATNVVAAGLTTVDVEDNAGGSVQSILGTLNIENPGSYNTVIINDSADTADHFGINLSTLAVNPNDQDLDGNDPWGSITGLAPATINYEYADTNSLVLDGPNSTYNYYYIAATGVPTTINGGPGYNTFYVGVDSNFTPGQLQNINGLLTINGRGVYDTVALYDFGNTSTDAVSLSATGFSGVGAGVNYSGIQQVSLDASRVSGSLIVVAPQSGMTFYVDGPSASDDDLLLVENSTVPPDEGYPAGSGYFVLNGTSYRDVYYSGIQFPDPTGLLLASTDAGVSPEVKVYDAQTGVLGLDLHPFNSNFLGGVRVAVGDVNNDGIFDIITAEGPGSASDGDSLIQIFDGRTGQQLAGPLGLFDPFPGFHGGLYVAAADVNGDGFADIIVGQGGGGQGLVNIYSGKTGALLTQFQPYGDTSVGVRVAAGPVVTTSSGAIHVGVVTGEGSGGPPLVDVFDGPSLVHGNDTPVASFDAFAPSFTGGVYVATGLISGQGKPPAEIIAGEGAGGEPRVSVFSGSGTQAGSFLAFDPGFHGGVRVAAADVTGSGRSDIIAAQGPGPGSLPQVRAFDGVSLQQIDQFFAFPANQRNGMFVAGGGRWGLFNAGDGTGSDPALDPNLPAGGDSAGDQSVNAMLPTVGSGTLSLELPQWDQVAATLAGRNSSTTNDPNKDVSSSVLNSLTPANLPTFLAATVTGLQRKPLASAANFSPGEDGAFAD